MVDRIRSSLELNVVLQIAVDEVSALLHLDRCLFFWYLQDEQCLQVVCERICDGSPQSYLAEYSLPKGTVAAAIGNREALINRDSNVRKGWRIKDWRIDKCVELRSDLTLLNTQVSLLMPVKGQSDSIGFIACLGDRPRRWNASEVEFMQAIAQHLEIAIRQAQLYEQTRKQAQQEHLINRITSLTRQSFDLNTILTEAIAQIFEALEVDRGLVHLVEAVPDLGEGVRRQHLYEVCRPPYAASQDAFDVSGPITQWVIQHRQQVAIVDIAQDSRIGADNAEYQAAQIRSSLVVPVQAGNQLHAIVYLNQCSHLRRWSREDCKLAQAVADQLAISIQQACLYTQMHRQAIASAAQAQHLAETLAHLRQTQAQLIRSERMSSLGQLVAGLAHEINNPISFIYGNIPYIEHYVEDLIALMQCYQSRFPQIAEDCQDLAKAVDLDFILQDLPRTLHSLKTGAARIRAIVQSLRSFVHLDQAQRRPIDLHEELESALALLHPQISPNVHIVRHYGELLSVRGYQKLLHQVIVNVLMNAIEALSQTQPSQPKILTLTTAAFSDLKTAEPWVSIVIRDTGCGIPLQVQSKIFDPFFTTKAVGQGTGLGLAISYHAIVNQHQGHLSFQSQPQQGSEFVIELPASSKRSADSSSSLNSSEAYSTSVSLIQRENPALL